MNLKQNSLIRKNLTNNLLFLLLNIYHKNNILSNIRKIANNYYLYAEITDLSDFDYFRYIESETEDYPDENEYKYWNSEKLQEKINKLNEILDEEKNNIINNSDNLIKKFKKIENIVMIETDGLIIYGSYKSYSINIQQDPDTKQYTLYLWKKDLNENALEFNIKDNEELQKFFDDNDILVKWED